MFRPLLSCGRLGFLTRACPSIGAAVGLNYASANGGGTLRRSKRDITTEQPSARGSWRVVCAEGPPPAPVTDPLAPLVVVGPSGVGKGTLIKRLMEEFPDCFGFSVSSTTRKPRPGEVDGVDYHFASFDVMKKEAEEGKFVEHANVHTNMYGTSKAALEQVRAAGKIAILDIDIQGALQVKERLPGAHFVFLMPPSEQVLESRLRSRGTETEEKIQVRLRNAQGEIQFAKERHDFFDRVIVPDDGLVEALPEVRSVLQAWHPRLCK